MSCDRHLNARGTDAGIFVLCPFVMCSCAALSSTRSARRKPNRSRRMTRWRRRSTRCHPRPNCSTTTGKAASPRCIPRPPPPSESLTRTSALTHVHDVQLVYSHALPCKQMQTIFIVISLFLFFLTNVCESSPSFLASLFILFLNTPPTVVSVFAKAGPPPFGRQRKGQTVMWSTSTGPGNRSWAVGSRGVGVRALGFYWCDFSPASQVP